MSCSHLVGRRVTHTDDDRAGAFCSRSDSHSHSSSCSQFRWLVDSTMLAIVLPGTLARRVYQCHTIHDSRSHSPGTPIPIKSLALACINGSSCFRSAIIHAKASSPNCSKIENTVSGNRDTSVDAAASAAARTDVRGVTRSGASQELLRCLSRINSKTRVVASLTCGGDSHATVLATRSAYARPKVLSTCWRVSRDMDTTL
jgi:hypothetical protein